jgi:hypothetical protein
MDIRILVTVINVCFSGYARIVYIQGGNLSKSLALLVDAVLAIYSIALK